MPNPIHMKLNVSGCFASLIVALQDVLPATALRLATSHRRF